MYERCKHNYDYIDNGLYDNDDTIVYDCQHLLYRQPITLSIHCTPLVIFRNSLPNSYCSFNLPVV
jgi:hypothetical protein